MNVAAIRAHRLRSRRDVVLTRLPVLVELHALVVDNDVALTCGVG